MKKIVAMLLAAVCLCTCLTQALAIGAGEARVVLGADLSSDQQAQMYRDFGIEKGSVKELSVTNAEERSYLAGLVDESHIGTRSISCVFLVTLDKGAGLQISTRNISWCSKEMYQNALLTAGITDARVMISAPTEVSGTAALTGIYKAYEDITGESLSALAKDIGVQELVTTGELAQYLGNTDATTMVSELKKILSETKKMTDDQVRIEILAVAKHLNITLTEEQVKQLLALCRKLEGLSDNELAATVTNVTEKLKGLSAASEIVSTVVEKAKTFFASVGEFFSNIFRKRAGD